MTSLKITRAARVQIAESLTLFVSIIINYCHRAASPSVKTTFEKVHDSPREILIFYHLGRYFIFNSSIRRSNNSFHVVNLAELLYIFKRERVQPLLSVIRRGEVVLRCDLRQRVLTLSRG
ncbi:hypothetical protein PUN28_003296 [Cardiocondyla obscurior]|uniref:Uncharacterized protein n=1 Tax=Cardiocondyla obscurior TaxID=286306 RepID=A0AAW2GK64_9HYME